MAMKETPATATRTSAVLRRPRILALGLGNLLLTDDGVGVHAARRLREFRLPGVLAVDVGAAVLDALHLIERADRLLAIDAMRARGAPGTIYTLAARDVRNEGLRHSTHELSLMGVLRLARRQPEEILILAVEPARIDFGDQLSEPVARVLPDLLTVARRIIAHWQKGLCSSEIPSGPPAGRSGVLNCSNAHFRGQGLSTREWPSSNIRRIGLQGAAG